MPNKINLITPPDNLYNNNFSLNLINTTDAEKEKISNYLSKQKDDREINLYAYTNESNPTWLLNKVNGEIKTYINLDNTSDISVQYTSYILSKSNVYYYTEDKNMKEVYSLISTNNVTDINNFLDKVYNEQ
jgi:hypothetical protein|tara:strand:- start:2753 stop:3145 length:393 start_codon:yes stop_codon:yes gene_type:complete